MTIYKRVLSIAVAAGLLSVTGMAAAQTLASDQPAPKSEVKAAAANIAGQPGALASAQSSQSTAMTAGKAKAADSAAATVASDLSQLPSNKSAATSASKKSSTEARR